MKHFLRETDFSEADLAEVISLAHSFKRNRGRHTPPTLQGQSWIMLFTKQSTRTRLSFEVGISELGGNAIYMDAGTSQLGRGESIADTAKVMSRYAHGLIIRTYRHEDVEAFAEAGSIPVINALTDLFHPCQAYTDLFTIAEHFAGKGSDPTLESLRGKKLAFLGDTASNMAHSLILGAYQAGMEVSLSGPASYRPSDAFEQAIADLSPKVEYAFEEDPALAVKGADVIYTDVWVSMGQDAEREERLKRLQPFQVNSALMAAANPNAIFMHCLPAHPDEEVSQEVYESPASIVFDQAENRLHVQKAILSILAASARH